MTLVKWSPLKEFENMRRDMERAFDNTLDPFGLRSRWVPKASDNGVTMPKVDMYDRKKEVVVKAELPGVKKDDVEVTITKEALTIKGETKREKEVKDEDYYCSECSYGSFLRTLPLPAEVNDVKAKAIFKNGVLEITLPKLEEAKAREVKLNVE
ncbi:Hsp20/alpha crystallin family protein [bacterium]|nr:MAG: Hsp20/alpha crystallin family protein [bacterium]